MPWVWRPEKDDINVHFGNCHCGLKRRRGGWSVDAGLQYWWLFDVEVSDAEAQRILRRYREAMEEIRD